MAAKSHYRLRFASANQLEGKNGGRMPLPKRVARRRPDVLLATILALATLPAFLSLLGYRPLIVRSGSMAPNLVTGDLILSHLVQPSSIRVGDIITFSDPSRGDVLVTHRVVESSPEGTTYSFTTKGDRNTGVEEWNIDKKGRVGRLSLRVPKLGFAVAGISSPAARVALAGLSVALLMTACLPKIRS